jgi:hypothetical protein
MVDAWGRENCPPYCGQEAKREGNGWGPKIIFKETPAVT